MRITIQHPLRRIWDHVADGYGAVAISQVWGARATYHAVLPMPRKLLRLLIKGCGDLDG
jgi:hypothetical protein